MQNEIAADKQLRKRITLTGDPKFFDLLQATTLDAKTEIIVWLKPKPEPATEPRRWRRIRRRRPATVALSSPSQAEAQAQAKPAGGKFDIEVLRAWATFICSPPGGP